MKFTRHFTQPNTPIEDQIKWKLVESKITRSDGSIVFHMENIEVPDHWSQGAINILAQKYFRKAGVPKTTGHDGDVAGLNGLPLWLTPSLPYAHAEFGSETSAKQVFHRLAGAWTYWGWKEGIFCQHNDASHFWNAPGEDYEGAEKAARIFYDEIYFMLAHQYAAPNSPQWFNNGLWWAYGIKGDANGQWAVDKDGQAFETDSSYKFPQVHACYIQPISDNLVEKDGIYDLLTKEARLFKHGSGTGTNFSNIRGKNETLGGGGRSSGLMSFLKVLDVSAGSISSGGTTRRAAKLICLNPDHPEIEDFIDWKMKEERKARALVLGSELLNDGGEVYSDAFEGEAINTVSAQNANNSVRITNDFLDRVDGNHNWQLISRKGNKIVKTLKAKDLWNKINLAAWTCGDPGLLFHDNINQWNTVINDGEILACNPCGEYQFLDNTACNLASLNLGKFLKNGEFQIKDFEHATRLWIIVLEISVFMASFPSREIAENSYAYRTLGLGYMNLGGILMRKGLSYDSDKGRDLASSITALMHGISYLTSAEMAEELGPFSRFEENKESMINVIKMHFNLTDQPNITNEDELRINVLKVWSKVIHAKSFRNAQVTLLAPTGTIHLVTDCDTSGIEPDFSLIKYKNLSGGGNIQIVNECVPEALKNLGYTPAQIILMLQHIKENGNLENFTINHRNLSEDHLKVFDCANPSGDGKRFLSPLSHVLMMASVQPFLSGAISKTCNLPNSATIQDVDFIYREAHRLGLKAIAIYRDGSKLTQPLSSKKEEKLEKRKTFDELSLEELDQVADRWREKETILGSVYDTAPSLVKDPRAYVETIGEAIASELRNTKSPPELQTYSRKPLPPRRKGYALKVRIDGQSVYLRTGEYEDGKLGEITLEISREGSTVRALLGGFSKLVSVALQFGVPLEQLVKSFVYTKFEPAGLVQDHDSIKMTTSVLDFVFRELAIHYLGQNEFANVTQDEAEVPIFLDLDSLKSPLPLHEKTLETELVAYETQNPKPLNFTGNSCPNCGHNTLKQTGTCVQCTTCGQDSGCG